MKLQWTPLTLALLAIPSILLGAGIQSEDSAETRYGAHLNGSWIDFVVYAPDAASVTLLLYTGENDSTPSNRFPLTKHGDDWRVRIKGDGCQPGLLYMYETTGANDVDKNDQFGKMFNKNYPLNDPYAYQTQNVKYDKFFTATPYVDRTSPVYAGGGKSVVYDHSQDLDPGHKNVAPQDLIIYEMHVQDFTARLAGLAAGKRGTYAGMAQEGLTTPGGLKAGIDHLVELGVTAVELMPVMEYDEDSGNEPDRYNHWGYMTSNFFAPETRYAADPSKDVREFKELVKALHDRNIAVFMDVVYNHSAEQTPWVDNGRLAAKYYNFNGLASEKVYKSSDNNTRYAGDTGAGNTVSFAGGDRYTKKLTTDSLALWHKHYGIDGFRFDLAPVLANGSNDAADWVDNDPRYVNAPLHAEPWGGGLWWEYMDNFGWGSNNNRWGKWGGQYRDCVRKFSKSSLADRARFKRMIEGYGLNPEGGPISSKPTRSVNIVSVHDGYTQRDVVYLNDNGDSHNCWDSGGDENLRREREKLLSGILLTSQGVPLILQGAEFGVTKSHASTAKGKHDSYNYESISGDASVNHVNWIDWRLKDGDKSESTNGPTYGPELFAWTKRLIELRRTWTHFRRAEFAPYVINSGNGGANAGAGNDGRFTYTWEGPETGSPTQIAVVWWGKAGEPDLMVIYNENHQEVEINNLADWSQGDWKILARSWFGNDADFETVAGWSIAPAAGNAIKVKGRSMAILISDND